MPFHRLLANRIETVNIKEISLESKIICRDDKMIRPAVETHQREKHIKIQFFLSIKT